MLGASQLQIQELNHYKEQIRVALVQQNFEIHLTYDLGKKNKTEKIRLKH